MINIQKFTKKKLILMLLLSMTIMVFSALAYQSQLKGRQTLAVAYASPSTVKATLVFSTYIGGTAWENLRGIATDPQGYIYITGGTNSADYPTTMGPPHQGPDHTLAKRRMSPIKKWKLALLRNFCNETDSRWEKYCLVKANWNHRS
jgi:hypothetical protein